MPPLQKKWKRKNTHTKKLLQPSNQWRTAGRRTLCNWTKGPQAAVHEHPLFSTRAHITQSMDYTFSLQVQHHLTVYPTHLYEDYSLELQESYRYVYKNEVKVFASLFSGDERGSKLTLLPTLLEILVKRTSNIRKPDYMVVLYFLRFYAAVTREKPVLARARWMCRVLWCLHDKGHRNCNYIS